MSGKQKTILPQAVEILEVIKEIALNELDLEPDQVAQIQMQTPLTKHLQMDSLAQVIFITQMEERFGLIFDLEDRVRFEKVETIEDLVRVVRHCARGAK